MTLQRIPVPLADRSYEVVVGEGARRELPALVPGSVRRIAVVTQESIPFAIDGLLEAWEHQRFVIGGDESAKTLTTVEELCRGFARFGLTRGDLVVAVGGGLVTDVAGFAAACFHRGVSVMHVPTSLLGMVDAAIGGKTGVNLPEGKNLVGAFWQPIGVVCDLDALASLPEREQRCGYGEMAKYHFLTGDDLLALPLAERIATCARIKAEVVAGDEREGGNRALLNYGHTLAHAIEIATEHRMAHGEAVAVGLVYAAELARELGRIDSERVDEHRRVITQYGLATDLPAGLGVDRLVGLMAHDKKAVTGLTFVLDGPRGVEVVVDVPRAPVETALARLEQR